MIRKLTDVSAALERLSADPVGNIYPIALLQGYPQDDAFYRAFESENGILVYAGGTAYLSGQFDEEELDSFLSMLGAQEIIAPDAHGNKYILVYQGEKQGSTAISATDAQLPEIRQLLCQNFPNMPDLADFVQAKTAQRLYLGGRTGIVIEEGRIASTASVLVQSDMHALLGAVATHPEHRKRGHAGNILHMLIGELLDNDKTPIILCDNPVAIHLYKGMGFEEYGKMTVKPYVFQ